MSLPFHSDSVFLQAAVECDIALKGKKSCNAIFPSADNIAVMHKAVDTAREASAQKANQES